jgi:hypothetical protein
VSDGQEERIVVVVSSRPLEEVRRFIGGLHKAGSGDAIAPGEETKLSMRGIGKVSTVPSETGRPLSALFEELNRRAAKDGTLWVWQVRLDNPGG